MESGKVDPFITKVSLNRLIDEVVSVNMLFQPPPTRVEVLNGSGIAGLAKRVADQLESQGFEIARATNAPSSTYDRSRIITNKGESEPALKIAGILGCGEISPDQPENADNDADVTVIVGRDYISHTQ